MFMYRCQWTVYWSSSVLCSTALDDLEAWNLTAVQSRKQMSNPSKLCSDDDSFHARYCTPIVLDSTINEVLVVCTYGGTSSHHASLRCLHNLGTECLLFLNTSQSYNPNYLMTDCVY